MSVPVHFFSVPTITVVFPANRVKSPLSTTPGIIASAASSAAGSGISSNWQSTTKFPLSVMTGPSFFTASRMNGRQPSPRSCAIAVFVANGIVSTGTTPDNRRTILASSTTTMNRKAAAGYAFFPGMRCAASLDHHQLRIDLVGAVNGEIEHRVIIQRG